MKSVLSNGGYDGAMAVWHDRFLIKRHQIAVALRVSNGGAMVAVIGLTVVAEWWLWRKKRFFFFNFSERTNWAVLGWPDPTLNPGFGILNETSNMTHTSTTRVLSPRSHEFSPSQQRRQRTATRRRPNSDEFSLPIFFFGSVFFNCSALFYYLQWLNHHLF